MGLLLEKLANHWQLRFVTIGLCLTLFVYAVVMPVHSGELATVPVGVKTGLSAAAVSDVTGGLSQSARVKGVGLDGVRLDSARSEGASSNGGRADEGSSGGASSGGASSGGAGAGRTGVGGGHGAGMEIAPWFEKNEAVATRLDETAKLFDRGELPRDAVELIRKLRRAAEGGDKTSQFLLGEAYQTGLGVEKDSIENARWYARASSHDAGASRELETAGIRTPHSYGEAFQLTREAAEAGDSMSELYIGLAYDRGDGLPKSFAKAAVWYQRAAIQGSVSAACDLGELYYSGEGVAKDGTQAAIWLTKAARQGSADAQYTLGFMTLNGYGVARNEAAAAVWLERAAAQGNTAAEVLLSSMYASGIGVRGSSARAYFWLNLAAAREPQLSEVRDELEADLPSLQVLEGQKLTHEWLIRHGPG